MNRQSGWVGHSSLGWVNLAPDSCGAEALVEEEAVIVTDLDGVVIEWDHSATALYGWTRSEAVGRPAGDLLVAWHGRERASTVMHQLFAAGYWEGVFELKRSDGTPVVVWVRNEVIPDLDGCPVAVIGRSRLAAPALMT